MIPRFKLSSTFFIATVGCVASLACDHRVQPRAATDSQFVPIASLKTDDVVEPSKTDGLLTIITDRTRYERNQHVIVTVENGTNHVLYDDHCAGELQGFGTSAKWNASDGVSRGCGAFTMAPPPGWKMPGWRERSVAIQPDGAHVDSFLVGQSAYPGTWRVELWLRNERGQLLREDQRISNLFKVVLPPE